MPIRLLAFVLVAGLSFAHAEPPASRTPKQDPANPQQAPETIDLDALARSKDVGAATPTDADTPPAQSAEAASGTSETIPPAAATPPEAPPVEAAPSEAPPASAETTTPPEAAAPMTEAPPAAAGAAAPTPDKSTKSAEAAEKISLAASCQSRATNLLDDAEKSDFEGASSAFDAKMRTALPPPKLKQQWDSLAQFGKLVARGQSHLGSGEGYTVVMIPLIFEKANLVAQIACGTDGRIAGFYIKPVPKQTSGS